MKQFLIAGVLIAGLLFDVRESCRAQAVFLTDVNGRVIMSNKYVDVQGSPYLTDDWKNGTVTTTRNQTYKDLKLRYDAYAGELEYEQNDKTYRVNSANVKEFTISDGMPLVFRNGFPVVNNNPATTFYQVLVDGPTKLLKQPKITMSENRAYNSATTVQQFQKQDWYFLVKPDGTAQRIQKSKKSVLAALPDQKEQLEKLIREKSLDLGEESGLTALVTELNAR